MHIHRVVSRYASVTDPVVASDGFTYEKKILQQYLDDCKQAGQSAISQQTKDILQETLYPNESLKKFVELLKDLKLPPQTSLSAPQPFSGEDDSKEKEVEQAPMYSASQQGPNRVKRDDGPHGNNPPSIRAQGANDLHQQQGGKGGHQQQNNNGNQSRHPCVRIYGLCNFGDDCVYASYPYESCLNYLKGKCRFGARCQEAHVDVQPTQGSGGQGGGYSGGSGNGGGGSYGGRNKGGSRWNK
jgi:hypothetical protein